MHTIAAQLHAAAPLTSFSSCRAEVVLYTIQGGWHEWPSIDSDAPMSELSASKVIVQYLEAQSR